MKNLSKHLMTVGLVATGVITAGYTLYQFRDVDLIKTSRNGFQGIS